MTQKIDYVIKHKELNYNVYYTFLIGINTVKYTYTLSYNSDNFTYFVGEFTNKFENYNEFTHKVQNQLLKYLGRNKKEISSINPNYIHLIKQQLL